MKIAIVGTRGIPANYGGFETFAEELSCRLADRGHDVTVYCRTANWNYTGTEYKGVRLAIFPAIKSKYLETISHTFISSIHVAFSGYDVCLYCNAANALFMIFPRLASHRISINVDGIERKRKKWNAFGRLWYLIGEKTSTILAHELVSDAIVIRDYYRERYSAESTFIPYGAIPAGRITDEALKRIGLKKDRYFLYVSRLEPENNAHVVIAAFEKLETDMNLVIVGSAPYSKRYIDAIKETKDRRIIFTGGIYGDGYQELQTHSFCYIHATEVGGTHPALIEGMSMSPCVIANNTPENREVLGKGGLLYKFNDSDDLCSKMKMITDNPNIRLNLNSMAIRQITEKYSWDSVVTRYENLFNSMVSGEKNKKSGIRKKTA